MYRKNPLGKKTCRPRYICYCLQVPSLRRIRRVKTSFILILPAAYLLLGHVHVPILMWLDNSAASFSAARLPDSSQSRVCLRPSSGSEPSHLSLRIHVACPYQWDHIDWWPTDWPHIFEEIWHCREQWPLIDIPEKLRRRWATPPFLAKMAPIPRTGTSKPAKDSKEEHSRIAILALRQPLKEKKTDV